MSTYCYLRVSTDTQDVDTQKIGIEEFCQRQGWEIDDWVRDEGVSGAKDPSKRKLGGLLNALDMRSFGLTTMGLLTVL